MMQTVASFNSLGGTRPYLITFTRLTMSLLHVNRLSPHCQLLSNNSGIVFGCAAMHFWHYPTDLEKGGPSCEHETSKPWNAITRIGIRRFSHERCRAQQKAECVMEIFYVFPNQKQNWKLSFVFCLRVVIWLGIITWLWHGNLVFLYETVTSIYTVYLDLSFKAF